MGGRPRRAMDCLAQTVDSSLGSTWQFNGCGTRLCGSSDVCPTCHSIVQQLWITVFYVPVIPRRRYRVLWATPHRYFSRAL